MFHLKEKIKKLSELVGFTETEIKVILFLIFIPIIGYFYFILFLKNNEEYRVYDYSKQDSTFLAVIKNDSLKSVKNNSIDLSAVNKKDKIKGSNRININTATFRALLTLPGIGKKTAKNIILYRKQKKIIHNLKELLKIKGIGKIKFNKIKKYLYIKK